MALNKCNAKSGEFFGIEDALVCKKQQKKNKNKQKTNKQTWVYHWLF